MIPEDWNIMSYGDISNIKRGASPRPIEDPKYFGHGRGWIRISDVSKSSKYLEKTRDYLSQLGESKSVIVNKGEIIMSIAATVGRPILVKMDACIHDGFIVFSNLSGDIYPEFLYYVLKKSETSLSKTGQQGTQSNINSKLVAELKFLKPSKTEQKKIAKVLSDYDELINSIESLIQKKKNIKQGAMQELLTGKSRLEGFSGEWETKRLGELLNYEQPTAYLVQDTNYDDSYTIPVLTAGKSFILGYTNEDKGIFQNYPVIIFDDFTTDSKFVKFPFKVKSSAMKILKPKTDQVNLEFVFKMMQIINFSREDHKRYWLSEYQFVEVKIPKLNEQNAISKILSDMDSEIQQLQTQKEKYINLKQAMMQKLLTGEIRLV